MNIIQYNDNDHLHKPQTDGTAVYSVDPNRRSLLTREEILTKFLLSSSPESWRRLTTGHGCQWERRLGSDSKTQQQMTQCSKLHER